MSSPYFFPLVGRREIASGTIEFLLDATGSNFVFRAGQWVDVVIGNDARTFSIASAPKEGSPLHFAMRVGKSVYKQNLMALPLGMQLKVSRPAGSFVLPEDATRPVVFFAGGIGITPVRSIVASAFACRDPRSFFVFYSNRASSEAAYLDEFIRWSNEYRVQFIPTITTDSFEPAWRYERGRIDRAMIERYTDQIIGDRSVSPIFYISGPPDMVLGTWQLLHSMGVAADDIVAEEFSGY